MVYIISRNFFCRILILQGQEGRVRQFTKVIKTQLIRYNIQFHIFDKRF
jgi:hypothetical protein